MFWGMTKKSQSVGLPLTPQLPYRWKEERAGRRSVASAVDTSNFDPQFTHEAPTDSVVESSEHLSETFQRKFADFSYDGSRLQASPA